MHDEYHEQVITNIESDMTSHAAAQFAALVTNYFDATRDVTAPVSTSLTATQLAARFDEPLPQWGTPLTEVLARLERDVIADSNRLYHPRAAGHQCSPPLPAAIWTESVIGALNQSVAVAEMSPTGTAIEHRVVRWMCDLVGFGSSSGGTLTSGGTEATFTALLAARAALLPDAWINGVGAEPPVVVCGEHTHYAIARAIGELGIGSRNTVVVPSREWRMNTDALIERLDELAAAGRSVMAVVATAGSTATGAIDDLDTIGQQCEARGIWMHVDGAHGASALLSERDRHRLRGIERARSIAWDPHKMMLLPLAAGLLLVRDERDLERAFSQRAPYLFHGGESERVVDQGIRSFQCSRRADVIKLWVALQRYGARGIGALYDGLCHTTRVMHAVLEAHPLFVTLHEPEANILCFRYVGDGSMNDAELDTLNRELRERYNRSGAGWITATDLRGRRVLRVTIMNPRTTAEDVNAIVYGLAREAALISLTTPS
ncbi:MAG: pyridoxal-dependent decarboxylase [bacterium]